MYITGKNGVSENCFLEPIYIILNWHTMNALK